MGSDEPKFLKKYTVNLNIFKDFLLPGNQFETQKTFCFHQEPKTTIVKIQIGPTGKSLKSLPNDVQAALMSILVPTSLHVRMLGPIHSRVSNKIELDCLYGLVNKK